MTKRTRRVFNASFKAKVALEALRERQTVEQIAKKYELPPNQVSNWKKEFINNAAAAFDGGATTEESRTQEATIEKLYAQIGQLKVKNDWMKKKLQ